MAGGIVKQGYLLWGSFCPLWTHALAGLPSEKLCGRSEGKASGTQGYDGGEGADRPRMKNIRQSVSKRPRGGPSLQGDSFQRLAQNEGGLGSKDGIVED